MKNHKLTSRLLCTALLLALVLAAAGTGVLTGCGRSQEQEKPTRADEVKQPANTTELEEEPVNADETKQPTDPTALIVTGRGTITVRLYSTDAPETVANFIGHAKAGYYDDLIFFRVMANFMAQTGDPTNSGGGGKTFSGKPLPDEIDALALGLDKIIVRDASFQPMLIQWHGSVVNAYLDRSLFDLYTEGLGYKYTKGLGTHKVTTGSLAMANSGPATGGSQFFIVTGKHQAHLDGKHTVFGEVTEGIEIARAIQKRDKLISITIVEP